MLDDDLTDQSTCRSALWRNATYLLSNYPFLRAQPQQVQLCALACHIRSNYSCRAGSAVLQLDSFHVGTCPYPCQALAWTMRHLGAGRRTGTISDAMRLAHSMTVCHIGRGPSENQQVYAHRPAPEVAGTRPFTDDNLILTPLIEGFFGPDAKEQLSLTERGGKQCQHAR